MLTLDWLVDPPIDLHWDLVLTTVPGGTSRSFPRHRKQQVYDSQLAMMTPPAFSPPVELPAPLQNRTPGFDRRPRFSGHSFDDDVGK